MAFAENTSVASPTPTPIPPSPATSTHVLAHPHVGWLLGGRVGVELAYVSGDVVSYGGDQWTANQWNYDEVPGGASGAWNNDGAC